MSLAQFVQQGFNRYGAIGGLQRVARVTQRRFRNIPRIREVHVWYALALTEQRPRLTLPEGFECRRAGTTELPLLQPLETVGFFEAQARLAIGAELWLICHAGRAACAFWIFRRGTPVRAARGGWLELPADTVCLEDSITAAEYRGRGLICAGWRQMAEAQTQAGMRTVLTKVVEDNLPSRRAVEKAGFQPIARMTFERVWLVPHVRLAPLDGGLLPGFMFQEFNR